VIQGKKATEQLPPSLGADGIAETVVFRKWNLMQQLQLGMAKVYNLFHMPQLSPEMLAGESKVAMMPHYCPAKGRRESVG
jgi:hypothetical protein